MNSICSLSLRTEPTTTYYTFVRSTLPSTPSRNMTPRRTSVLRGLTPLLPSISSSDLEIASRLQRPRSFRKVNSRPIIGHSNGSIGLDLRISENRPTHYITIRSTSSYFTVPEETQHYLIWAVVMTQCTSIGPL